MFADKPKREGKLAGCPHLLPFVAMDARQLIGLPHGLDQTIRLAQRQQWRMASERTSIATFADLSDGKRCSAFSALS